jgi:hypothetical protein
VSLKKQLEGAPHSISDFDHHSIGGRLSEMSHNTRRKSAVMAKLLQASYILTSLSQQRPTLPLSANFQRDHGSSPVKVAQYRIFR